MIWILQGTKNHSESYHTIFLGVNETPTLNTRSNSKFFH